MAAEKRDYYEVLGIDKNADEQTIKRAFKRLAMKYHPDRNQEPGAEEKFKEINEAYAVLSDQPIGTATTMTGIASSISTNLNNLTCALNSFWQSDVQDLFNI